MQCAQQASKIIMESDRFSVQKCENPPKWEIPAKIGTPKKNDSNVETVRDGTKLYIRHQQETDIGLSIGDVTFGQRRHLAAKTTSGLGKNASNS